MPQSRTNYENMLKDVYGKGLRNAINETSVILTEIQRRADKIDFEGLDAVWAVHTGRSNSTASIAELGTLPSADRQKYIRLRQRTKTIVHPIKLSREVIASTRSSTGAFARAMEQEMRGAEADLKNNVGRQIYGTGRVQDDSPTVLRTGVIANVDGVVGSVITLVGYEEGAEIAFTDGEMRYFFVGMKIDAIDPADGSLESAAGGMEITAIDFAARTITVDDATGVSADDWICVHKSYDNEFMGLRVLINDAAGDQWDNTNTALIHNASSATNPSWASPVVGSRTTPVDEMLFENAYNESFLNGVGKEPPWILGSVGQRSELASQLQAQKRYDGRQMTLTAGWKGLEIARGTYFADRYAPDDDMFLVDPKELIWFQLEPFQWDDEDGKVLFKTDDQLAYEARFFGMQALGIGLRNSAVRVKVQPV